jgi:hypothetical protein
MGVRPRLRIGASFASIVKIGCTDNMMSDPPVSYRLPGRHLTRSMASRKYGPQSRTRSQWRS